MMTHLAQGFTPSFSPSFLFEAVGLLCLALMILYYAKEIFTRKPKLSEEFVAKTQYEKEREEVRLELQRHAGARKGIYEKLEAQAKTLEGLERTSERQAEDSAELKHEVGKINERIDAVPGRVINLLRETKNLI